MTSLPQAGAQVSVEIGAAPDCPYGYYEVTPYGCAPSGYYGPEWFTGGIFIGAGPWFHGANEFQGHVNNRRHPEHGYKGPCQSPARKPSPQNLPAARIVKEMKFRMDVATFPAAKNNRIGKVARVLKRCDEVLLDGMRSGSHAVSHISPRVMRVAFATCACGQMYGLNLNT
jgi:hypothetical protein